MVAHTIVVGGGLGGLSAAHTVMEQGGTVTVIDKNAFFGGNSTKATSGINGSMTKAQREKGILDTPEIFFEDTMRGGSKRADLAKVLTYESGPGVEWLTDNFGLNLSLLARLGGHSQPRTHRGPEKFPGMTITYALMEKLEDIAETNDGRARCIMKAKVTKLLMENGRCVGCEYEQQGKTSQVQGNVVLATGGYGCDFGPDSLLAQYRKDLLPLPTTNGEHCTGDGIKMALAIGGTTVDLEWVQVHPTGLVHPDEPDSKVKFLAAEALRGVGGLILDADGHRIANELGRRDYVTGQMWKNKGPFRLLLNKKASEEIAWHCKHYRSRKIMKLFETGADVAKEMGVDPKVLEKTLSEYNTYAKQMDECGGDGGPYDAYPKGKSFDPFGKKFFVNHPVEMGDCFNVSIITPVIHYTMGGVQVSAKAEILGANQVPIPGLYGAGEINGGIHGENRLGGNSLLDCVVFGRVAGRSATKEILQVAATKVSKL